MEKLNKNLINIISAVKSGKITVVKDQYGNVKGVGVNNPDLKVSEVSYVKNVGCGQAVGRTLEELEADEKALREFASTHNMHEILEAVHVGEVLKKETWDDRDMEYIENILNSYINQAVSEDRRSRPTPTVTRTSTPTEATRGKYPNLYEQLNVLDVETLKEMKRVATRTGADDLKNACRTVLRHKGVNC